MKEDPGTDRDAPDILNQSPAGRAGLGDIGAPPGSLDCRGMRFATLSRRLIAALLAVVVPLVIAPAAMAADGVGVYGRTDDKVVTFFAFGLIAFFAIFVTVLSLIQIRLDNRKERRTQDLERLGSR